MFVYLENGYAEEAVCLGFLVLQHVQYIHIDARILTVPFISAFTTLVSLEMFDKQQHSGLGHSLRLCSHPLYDAAFSHGGTIL